MEIDGEVVIGREGADLTIADPELSRHHARIKPVDGGVEVEDLGSTNGTYIGSQRITQATAVQLGSRVRVGKTTLELKK